MSAEFNDAEIRDAKKLAERFKERYENGSRTFSDFARLCTALALTDRTEWAKALMTDLPKDYSPGVAWELEHHADKALLDKRLDLGEDIRVEYLASLVPIK